MPKTELAELCIEAKATRTAQDLLWLLSQKGNSRRTFCAPWGDASLHGVRCPIQPTASQFLAAFAAHKLWRATREPLPILILLMLAFPFWFVPAYPSLLPFYHIIHLTTALWQPGTWDSGVPPWLQQATSLGNKRNSRFEGFFFSFTKGSGHRQMKNKEQLCCFRVYFCQAKRPQTSACD